MSKKKGKAAARKAPARKTTARRRTTSTVAAETTGITSQVTIFLYRTASGIRIRTSPQRAYAGPGHIEWTVVNLVDGTDVPVRITWPGESPWTKDPIEVRSWFRRSADGVKPGVYKYVVHAFDAIEDPEIEFPQN